MFNKITSNLRRKLLRNIRIKRAIIKEAQFYRIFNYVNYYCLNIIYKTKLNL